MRVVVTGATGFIGRGLVHALARDETFQVVAAARSAASPVGASRCHGVGSIDDRTDWTEALAGADAVVHLAARAHRAGSAGREEAEHADRVNHRATAKLAGDAVRAGVRRMVFVSTIGVHGVHSTGSGALGPGDPIRPRSAYAESKARAEEALRRIAASTGLEAVVIRPPLVYGPGAPGSFGRLVSLVRSGVPLPFAGIDNRRSMVARDNLVHLIKACLQRPGAAGKTFLVSDGEDLSTPQLVRAIAAAMGRRARLFRVPDAILGSAIGVAAGEPLRAQLLASLRVDMSDTMTALAWRPPRLVADCLRESVHEAVA